MICKTSDAPFERDLGGVGVLLEPQRKQDSGDEEGNHNYRVAANHHLV